MMDEIALAKRCYCSAGITLHGRMSAFIIISIVEFCNAFNSALTAGKSVFQRHDIAISHNVVGYCL